MLVKVAHSDASSIALFWPNYAKIMLIFFQIMPLFFKLYILFEKIANNSKSRKYIFNQKRLVHKKETEQMPQ